ncbi:NACHT domain-containing protein [Mycena sanguinolenta]|uniref:NACHT domain-containing protein n=1 Tax=Mycena sanguinolenta TaxID=230812 RepID=A0A8H6YTH9_9AGAR|nr:NACHT domain-containing protein [Mycena sanguinolenta]
MSRGEGVLARIRCLEFAHHSIKSTLWPALVKFTRFMSYQCRHGYLQIVIRSTAAAASTSGPVLFILTSASKCPMLECEHSPHDAQPHLSSLCHCHPLPSDVSSRPVPQSTRLLPSLTAPLPSSAATTGTMAFFESSHNFQINGGFFYNVAGNMSVAVDHGHGQRLGVPLATYMPGLNYPQEDLDFIHAYGRAQQDSHLGGTSGTGGAEIWGVQRNARYAKSNSRHHPYGTSGRPRLRQLRTEVQFMAQPRSPTDSSTLAVSFSGLNFEEIDKIISDTTGHTDSSDESSLESLESQNDFELASSFPFTFPFAKPVPNQPTTTINGGTFVSNDTRREGERGIDLLHSAVALAALHDSVESFPQPKCHPDTRTEILRSLHEWSLETDPSSAILWLYGPAGAGKSAIMQTLARELRTDARLGASFFFKRGHATRGDGKTLFTTIAYQLAVSASWLKAPISCVVEEDPSVIARDIETQLRELISEPSQRCNAEGDGEPMIIVIDGLDECEGKHIQEEILRALRHATSHYRLPFRFIVASRPEPHICELFEAPFYAGAYCAFNVEQSFEDVRTYLGDEFARIQREHRTMATIQSPWPAPAILEDLVLKSSGHFIYASTVIKFIDDKNYRPTERLAVVLQDGNDTDAQDSAFDALDQLYMNILSSAPRQAELLPLLCAIANFDFHPEMLDRLLGLAEGDARLLLRGLHSVLCIPDEADYYSHPISSYHASFFDFLDHPKRAQNFYVGMDQQRTDLARSLLRMFTGEFQTYVDLCGDWGSRSPLASIPLIISLPPSHELLSFIQRMNPDYVFELWPNMNDLIPWLKNIPSVPEDLVQLWEDYEYMSFFVQTVSAAKSDPTPSPTSQYSAEDILSRVPELLRLLQVLLLVVDTTGCLRQIRLPLKITWNDLRSTICALRPMIGRDDGIVGELVNHLLHRSFGGETYPWPSLSRELARELIHIVSACDRPYKRTIFSLSFSLSYLVRSSPPCLELLSDLWTVLPLHIWDDLHSVECYMYHVSRWLELFPDPPLQLLTFWRQSVYGAKSDCEILDAAEIASANHHLWENDWREYVNPQTYRGSASPSWISD